MKSCFMFGHRDCPEDILPKLEATIEKFYTELDIRFFYVGNRGQFDRLAAIAVKRIKKKYPQINLFLVLSYHPGERPVQLADGFDGSFYPPLENVPRRYAIVWANRYMIDISVGLICYVKHFGNTRDLLEYAKRKEPKVFLENVI